MGEGEDVWEEFHRQLFPQHPPEGGDGLPDTTLVDTAVSAGAALDMVTGRARVLNPGFGLGLTVGGMLGLAAAFMLAVDKYRILEDPSFQPSCNLNPVLSCGSVMVTEQAELFGFPNPLIGIISFTAVIVVGVFIAARIPLPRWVIGGLACGGVLGSVFVHWLIFQSLYRIGALCPWCMVVWAVTIPITVWTTLLFARSASGPVSRVADELWAWRFLMVSCWYLAIVLLALERFWSYWRTLL